MAAESVSTLIEYAFPLRSNSSTLWPLMENGPRLAVTAYSIRIFAGHSSALGQVGGCACASTPSRVASARPAKRLALLVLIRALQQAFSHVAVPIGKTQPDGEITQRRRQPNFDSCLRWTGLRPVELECFNRPRPGLDGFGTDDQKVIGLHVPRAGNVHRNRRSLAQYLGQALRDGHQLELE